MNVLVLGAVALRQGSSLHPIALQASLREQREGGKATRSPAAA
jgi:hypothetical protein